jgi:hypothetical protein
MIIFTMGGVVALYTPTNVEKSPTHLVCPWRQVPESRHTITSIQTPFI